MSTPVTIKIGSNTSTKPFESNLNVDDAAGWVDGLVLQAPDGHYSRVGARLKGTAIMRVYPNVVVVGTAPPANASYQFLSDGDSKEGYGAGDPGDPSNVGDFYAPLRWTIETKNLLGSKWVDFRNYGKSGQTTAQMLSDFSSQVLSQRSSMVTKPVVFIGGGINGMGINGTTAAQEYANKKQLVQLALAAGFLPVIDTCTPLAISNGPGYSITNLNKEVSKYNTMIRQGQADMGYALLLDWMRDRRFSLPMNYTDQAIGVYWDGLHSNERGNKSKGDTAALLLTELVGTSAYKVSTPIGDMVIAKQRGPARWTRNVVGSNVFGNTAIREAEPENSSFKYGPHSPVQVGPTSDTVRACFDMTVYHDGGFTCIGWNGFSSDDGGGVDQLLNKISACFYMQAGSGICWFANEVQSSFMEFNDGDVFGMDLLADKVIIYRNGVEIARPTAAVPDNAHLDTTMARAGGGVYDVYDYYANPIVN